MELPLALKAVYPWEGEYLAVDGGRMHYLDVGPRDAPPMLCLHGNPTWSFYWRKLVAHYSERFRVIVPDHIGCGLSDKPQGWPYRLEGHVANVEALIDHLDLQDITLVVHDWGGAIGMGAATRRPERFARFVVTNTAAFLSKDIPGSIAAVKIPGFGALAVRGLNAFARVATFRAVSKPLNLIARAGLLYPYRSWRSRIATLRFVEDIPMRPSHPSYATLKAIDEGLKQLEQPMLLCWGEDDFCFSPKFRAEWERRFPKAEVAAWEGVGHYVCEDAPQQLIDRMDAFLEEAA